MGRRAAIQAVATGLVILAGFEACLLPTDGLAPGASTSTSTGLGGSAGPGGSGASTTDSASSTSNAGGSNGYEDCLDGVDNNDDGLIDCADPACQPGFECVREAPEDLQLARVADRSFPSTALPCDDGTNAQSVMSDPGDPATCTSCSCAAAQNVGCAAPVLACYRGSASCGGNVDFASSQDDNNCHNFPGSLFGAFNDSCLRSAPSVPKGDCPPSGGATSLSGAWKRQRDVCRITRTGGGCGNGQVCTAKAVGAFDAQICAVVSGDESCPTGWSPTPLGYAETKDDRACSACTCSAPGGLTCTPGDISIYDADGCSDLTNTLGASCEETSGAIDGGTGSYRLNPGTVSGQGTCTPSGGQPTGEVIGEQPLTICCRP